MPQQAAPYAAPPPHLALPVTPGGMSDKTKIGIVIALIVSVIIGYFVWKDEQQFQRNRRASRTPAVTAPQPTPPPGRLSAAPAAPGEARDLSNDGWARMRLVGRWSTGTCSVTVFLRIDGTTLSSNGTDSLSGTWSYENRRLTVAEPDATTVLELISLGDREMVTQAQGRQQTFRRC